MTGLRLRGVRIPFGDGPGLDPISLEVGPGERLAVVGASGAGKTTLLRAIAGLAPVSAGAIDISGVDVTGLPPERRDAVYLHQAPVLFPHLDVQENVAFPLRVRRRPEHEVRERVAAVLDAVRMRPLAGRAVSTLSGGQRHRVALARAIAARPAVLLLDEPLSALDPELRDEVRSVILALQEADGPALVLVTHDLDDAGLLADRVAVLVGRRIAQVAPPHELFARPASLEVAAFLGFPNRLRGVVREDGAFECAVGLVERWHPRAVEPGPAVAVFQPEAARLTTQGAPGTVVEVRHRLRASTAIVDASGARVEAAVHGRPPRPGDPVHVTLNPARILVFPDA